MRFTGIDVVVPAHDEELLLGECLDALDRCASATPVPVRVTVVLDSCGDRSEALVRGRARSLHVTDRSVGAARAAGFDDALAHAPGPGERWLATTDADSRVPVTWLVDQLTLALAGADLVVGLVDVDDWTDWDPAVRVKYLDRYCSAAGHRHVHGANLGMSGHAYRAVGGFDPVPTDEDVSLVRRAEAAGLTVAWAGTTPVMTSARRSGRAPGGFSHHLASTEKEVAR